MSEAVVPPIESVTFVGYQGGELVWSVVSTRPSKEGGVLLNSKAWPFVKRLPCEYARVQSSPFEVVAGELYVAVDLAKALEGFAFFYETRIAKFTKHLHASHGIAEALKGGNADKLKESHAH